MQILGLEERTAVVQTNAPEGGTPSSAAAGQCGGILHSSTTCAACMDQLCCTQAKDCGFDPACQETSTCLANCSDDTCRAKCASFYTSPDQLMALRACRVTNCAAECGSTCGEQASTIASCDTCLQSTCCAEAAACAGDKNCAKLQLCRANCFNSMTCPADCEAQNPLGVAAFDTWFRCTDRCGQSCVPGQDWACLDRPIVWPKPKGAGNIDFSITFVDFTDEKPFVGSTVKACAKLDFTCSTPLSQTTTDKTGIAALSVMVGLAGFDGYLDISGGKVDGTGSAAFPAIWYPLPFVVADGWRGRSIILSIDEFTYLASAVGRSLDPMHGHFAANAADCDQTPAPGVSYVAESMDAMTQQFYLVSGQPDPTAVATDLTAIGGYLNLPTAAPARLITVKAISNPAGGKTVGSLSFIVRPGTLTTMSSYPPIP
jgi:hypothetical protein